MDVRHTKPAEAGVPQDFLWGTSTSAYQIEGGNTNNDWYRAGEKGGYQQKCGMACNHYEMYKEDVKLISSLGHKVFRFSIEWSRVETSDGVFDRDATEHYIDLCRLLCESGIKPWVTLYHFTNPIWFADKGEWNKRENVDCFLRFVEHIVPEISHTWICGLP